MALTPYNIVQGPATVYTGAFGATEPADTNAALIAAPNSSVWTDVGGTMDGTSVLIEVDQTYTDQGFDQLPIAVGARLTKVEVMVTAQLEEATLNNMQLALNQLATISTPGTGIQTLDPIVGQPASQPTYTAVLIDGWAPTLNTGASARARFIIRKCLSSSKLTQEYEKSKPAVYQVTWKGYWVSASINPFHVQYQTA